MAHILVVDDDKDLCALLRTALERDGHQVSTRLSGREVDESACRWADCILLDVMMPGEDGFALCRRIRGLADCPILFLTAKTEEADVLTGLGLGGDDYLTKPFRVAELRARVAAHLRREERRQGQAQVKFDQGLVIDYGARCLYQDGQPVHLAKKEFDIVELLSMHPSQVFGRERIYESVWGWDSEGDSSVVAEHIRRIRAKLTAAGCGDRIATIWGVGYKWQ